MLYVYVYINVVKGFQSFTRCALERGPATKDIALWRDLDNKNTAPVVPTKIYKNKGLIFEMIGGFMLNMFSMR